MEKLHLFADRYLFNRLVFKILMVVTVLVTAVPYLHTQFGGYVKLVLLYGFLVIAYELLTGKLSEALRQKTNWLLIGFCISYTVTLLLNRTDNLGAGIKSFAYVVVFFVLFCMQKNGQAKENLVREMKVLSFVIIAGTFILSAICMATFIFSVSGKYLNNEGIWVYYGMHENRLWGLYNPNTGSTLNCISILLSLGCVCTVKHKFSTVFNGVNLFLQFSCLLLTGSRASYLIMVVVLVLLTAFTVLKRFPAVTFRAIGVSALSVVIMVGAYVGLGSALKAGYAYLPGITNIIISTTDPEQSDSENKTELEKQDFTRLEELEDREGGFFNGRATMWAACFETFKEAPLFGVGDENLVSRTLVHFEDNTWVEHFRTGGAHNIYVSILTSCGIIGFLFLGAFAAITLIQSIVIYVKNYKKANPWLLTAICLCVLFYVTEFVEARIVFQVSTFSVFFWLFAGYMYNLALSEKQSI